MYCLTYPYRNLRCGRWARSRNMEALISGEIGSNLNAPPTVHFKFAFSPAKLLNEDLLSSTRNILVGNGVLKDCQENGLVASSQCFIAQLECVGIRGKSARGNLSPNVTGEAITLVDGVASHQLDLAGMTNGHLVLQDILVTIDSGGQSDHSIRTLSIGGPRGPVLHREPGKVCMLRDVEEMRSSNRGADGRGPTLPPRGEIGFDGLTRSPALCDRKRLGLAAHLLGRNRLLGLYCLGHSLGDCPDSLQGLLFLLILVLLGHDFL